MTEAAAARTRPLVLAADDDEDILALVAFRLERAGYSALHAELRPAALALLAGDGVQPSALGPAAAEVFAELLAHYARALSGPAHERIAKYFEATGAVDAQLRRLHSRLGWRRASAAFALGDMGSERAVPGLLRALGDDDRGVRNAAARSLGRLRAVAAIEPLVAAGVAPSAARGDQRCLVRDRSRRRPRAT